MVARAFAAAILVALLGACSGEEPVSHGGTPTPTVDASPAAPMRGGSAGAPAPTAVPGGIETSPDAMALDGTRRTAAPFVPRPAGTYRYATDGRTTFSGAIRGTLEMPPETTLAIDPARRDLQRSLRNFRDEDGNGRVSEMRLAYGSDGLRLDYLKTTTTFGGIKDEREFEPDPAPRVLRSGARPGDRATFTLRGSGMTARTTVDVLRRETVRVGGAAISALVVRLHSTFTGDVEGEDTSVQWLRPSDGLLLREDDASDVRSTFVRARTQYTAVLKRITPS